MRVPEPGQKASAQRAYDAPSIVPPDDPAYDETVALQVAKRGPGMLRGFGVRVDDAGHVPPEAREAAAAAAHIVRVELGGAAPDRR